MSDHDERPAAGPDLSQSTLSQLTGAEFDAVAAMGGVRGVLESTLPGLVFVVAYVATHELTVALIAASALAVISFLARLFARQSFTNALGGFFGVMIGVVWAWQSGEASDYFVWGFVTNTVYVIALTASVLVRWPLVGVVVALLRSEWDTWRSSKMYPRYLLATWFWIAMFGARLAVQVPLYLAGEVALLGSARLAMGLPLFALVMWFTWLLVREPVVPAPAEA